VIPIASGLATIFSGGGDYSNCKWNRNCLEGTLVASLIATWFVRRL
jgi:hypothetical protein